MTAATIAIVDDDTLFLDQMHALLNDAGYLVGTFRSLDNAYTALWDDPPGALIVGACFQDGRHGVDLITALKLREETRALPVILICADVRWLDAYEDRLRGRNIPALWMLPRPVDAAIVLQILAQVLDEPGQLEREAS